MKVCVTGGGGFIGSHLVDELLRMDYKVNVIDLIPLKDCLIEQKFHPNLYYYQGNILDIAVLNKMINECEYVFHQAALANVPQSFDHSYLYNINNEIGTRNVFTLSEHNNVKKVIYASSSAVYFRTSPYANNKYQNELDARKSNIPTVGLRYFNVYGERQRILSEGAVIPAFVDCCNNNRPCIIHGSGEQVRDFIYVKDVVNININAISKDYEGVYDIGTTIGTTINDLFKKIKFHYSKATQLYKEKRNGDVDECVSHTKIPISYNLDEGLNKTINWYKNIK